MDLTDSSPAINAGTAVGAPAVDFAGRPRDAHPDIGAYEWQSGVPAGGTPTPTPAPTITPTPTVSTLPFNTSDIYLPCILR